MKIQTLINKAAKCKTTEDAEALLGILQKAFGNAKPLRHLGEANAESYMEGETPLVRFELNHVISDDYITMIRPEIRDGEVSVYIETNRMLDGKGMMSQKWEQVDGMEDLIECRPEQTVAQVAELAAEVAIANHRMLIESVGVPMRAAEQAARSSW